MIMTKIGRNDACPCGSGKKYKRCCLVVAEAQASQECEKERDQAHLCEFCGHGYGREGFAIANEFDKRLNKVSDLFRSGKIDEAVAMGLEVMNSLPDENAGLAQSAKVYKARDDFKKAIDDYRTAAAFEKLELRECGETSLSHAEATMHQETTDH